MSSEFVVIPPDRLDTDLLTALVEEFVNREGTDYGRVERDFASKVKEVLEQVRRQQVMICYDPRSETCNLLSAEAFREYQRQLSAAAVEAAAHGYRNDER